MRAVWITKHGGPEVLQVRETQDPEPEAGQVRIRVRAAGLNFAELVARQGLYQDAPPPPCVVGYEVAGVVDRLGPGVQGPAVGTQVLAMVRFGGHADTICVPVDQVNRMPQGMSFEVAAALPVNYLTAHHMLFRVAALYPGETVLVHMAAGGVGLAALQLCRTVENVRILGTASPEKHDFLRAHGCDEVIDYRSKDYEAEVLRLTDGKGVHIVLDALGGNDWRKGYRLLRPVGRLVAFGFANVSSGAKANYWTLAKQVVQIPLFNPFSLMNQNRMVAGVNMGHLWGEVDMLQAQVRRLLELYEQGLIAPRVDKVFTFEQAADAHRYLHERRNVGKVVLVP